VGEHWEVRFKSRAGGQARVVLASEPEAREFAERHARAVTPSGLPLKWSDTNDVLVLTTVIGDYSIVRVTDDPDQAAEA
jgi:hypothetical protein